MTAGEGTDRKGGRAPGVILIDKPAGVTSFAMVRRVRRQTGIKKVGHAGTLDPFATGLLILCVGRPATRHIDRFMAGGKEYHAVLQLGTETDTQDPEGRVVRTAPVPPVTEEELRRCLSGFIGMQQQTPPPYSAVKHQGKPLYYYARRGIRVEKQPRQIRVDSLVLEGFDREKARLRIAVRCSPGTYIRVLAAEIGRQLGCGAHLVGLRRVASGGFSVADALSGHKLEGCDSEQLVWQAMIPLDQALAVCADSPGEPPGWKPAEIIR